MPLPPIFKKWVRLPNLSYFNKDKYLLMVSCKPLAKLIDFYLQSVHTFLFCYCFQFTHLCQMEFPTVINWTSLFSDLRVVGWIFFHFCSNLDRSICKQTVETLIRRGILRLHWVFTVCLRPTKWTLGLYGLK